MDKSYKPSEKQKKCKNAFPYMGKEKIGRAHV